MPIEVHQGARAKVGRETLRKAWRVAAMLRVIQDMDLMMNSTGPEGRGRHWSDTEVEVVNEVMAELRHALESMTAGKGTR